MPLHVLVILPFYVLLATAGLELVLARWLSPRSKGWLALLGNLTALGAVLAIWPMIRRITAIDAVLNTWDGPFFLDYRVDGLSLLFALIATGIGAAVLLYSIAYMEHEPAATRFYGLVLLFIAGMVHLVYSANLLVLYVSWEVIGLCSFLLVGFWYQNAQAAAGGRKVLVMTHLAGYGLLAAILTLYIKAGVTSWTDPLLLGSLNGGLFLLILLAAAAKSVQYPLHTWIPDAMAAPTPVSALLHSACYVKAGVYLVARLHSLGPWPEAWGITVTWLGAITIIIGALFALAQTDLKRLLAFSTVSQIGYMIVGLGLGTPLGVAAGLMHCLNHALFKGGLFLGAGAVQHATGTRDMNRLGGLGRSMPRTMLFWLVNASSVAGIPLLSGFISKWMLYNAALQAGQIIPTLAAWIGSMLTVFYMLKATSAVFLGPETETTGLAHEAAAPMRWGMGVLAAGSLALGLAPQLAVWGLISPALTAMGYSWPRLSLVTSEWWTASGLILAVLGVAAGGAVYLFYARRPAPAVQVALAPVSAGSSWKGLSTPFTGGEPLSGDGRLPATDFSAILTDSLKPFYEYFDPDRTYHAIGRGLVGVAEVAGRFSQRLEQHAVYGIPLVLIALILAGMAVPVASIPEMPFMHVLPGPATRQGMIVMACACGLALAGLFSASLVTLDTLTLAGLAFSGGMALAGLLVEAAGPRLVLLELAAFLVWWLAWRRQESRTASFPFLLVVLFSTGVFLGGTLALDAGNGGVARALLMAGFVLKLALIPLYFWLPGLAEMAPASLVGLLVAVVDMAAFGELWTLRQTEPWIFLPAGPWLILGILTALTGAVLMLPQRQVKRLLAFSTLEDLGYLTVALAAGGALGLKGALVGAAAHSLAKALLFSSLIAPEAEGPLSTSRRGLARRYPVSAFGFLVGSLAMSGVPPTLGFVARWRIYLATYGFGTWAIAALLLATGLALLAYSRVLIQVWWGENDTASPPRNEALPLIIALVALALVILISGCWPGLLSALAPAIGG